MPNKNRSQPERSNQQLTKIPRRISGVVKRHPDGYGFLIPDIKGVPDLYIAKHDMDGIMSNDKIRANVVREGARLRGNGIEIVSRETKKVTGQLTKKYAAQGVLKDQSFSWGEDLKVTWPPSMNIKDGEWVIVKIQTYPDHIRGFQGEVEAVLGNIDDPQNDNLRILAGSEIPYGFSKKAMDEASQLELEVREEDIRGRKDLRDKKFITIDGKTAKDFDDAIYVEKFPHGFRLWVAIADVSHYVREGTAIDQDAYKKGTSTYFPNFVSPMLPEALSNELCSLKPHVARLSMVAEMDIDFQGQLKDSRFYEAVIESKSRVTYGEAQEVIDGVKLEKHAHVIENIKLAGELAHILMRKRHADGSLNLEIPETIIELDDAGVPIDILRSERLFAHKLIEELMLIANVAVAKFLDKNGIPGLYRVHEDPKTEAIELLESYLQNFGYFKSLKGKSLQKRITEALQHFAGEPQETVLNILALRSMNQAQYSASNVGHFGLGFTHYSHFTSPIRRYPDLIVHRLIKSILYPQKGYRRMRLEELETAGTFLSACEQRSVKAERQIHSIKKARFLQKFLGQEFEGMISSVTRFGVFVLLKRYEIDGLLKIEELGGERFEFDEETLRLIAPKTGQVYEIGDLITVQVAQADVQTGRIDFVMPGGDVNRHAHHAKKNASSKECRPHENDRQRVRETRVSRPRREDKAQSRGSRKAHSRRHK